MGPCELRQTRGIIGYGRVFIFHADISIMIYPAAIWGTVVTQC